MSGSVWLGVLIPSILVVAACGGGQIVATPVAQSPVVSQSIGSLEPFVTAMVPDSSPGPGDLPANSSAIVAGSVRVVGEWSSLLASPSGADEVPWNDLGQWAYVIGHWEEGRWNLVAEGNRKEFCAALAAAPPELVGDVRDYFVGCK